MTVRGIKELLSRLNIRQEQNKSRPVDMCTNRSQAHDVAHIPTGPSKIFFKLKRILDCRIGVIIG